MARSNGKKKKTLVESNRELQSMFLRLRKMYWLDQREKLPGLDKVMVQFIKMDGYDGRHICDPKDSENLSYLPVSTEFTVYDSECEQVLLHEMAHLAVDRKRLKAGEKPHGAMWKAEMARLFKLGAFWDTFGAKD